MLNCSFKGLNLYLHVVHEDLSCHAHLQHAMHYQFAEGRKQISSFVKVVEPLHLRVFTDWGSQMASKHPVGCEVVKRKGEEGKVTRVINHEKSYDSKKRTKQRQKSVF